MASYPKTILASLQKMRVNKVMTDVTLKLLDDSTIACHKLILIAASPFFESMFQSGLKESLEQEVQLNFSDADTIRMMVEFIYSDEIDITEDNVETLVDTSEFLMLKDLKISCEDFMINMVRASNCSQLCRFGRKYDLKNLIASALEFTALHFENVVESSDFDNLAEEDVIEVISDDRLKAKNEGFVFESVVRWVNADLEARKEAFSCKIAPLIRFPFCTAEVLSNVVSREPLMLIPECMELITEAQHSQFHDREHPVRNLRTTPRDDVKTLVRMYKDESKKTYVAYTGSIEGETIKWNHFSLDFSGDLYNVMVSPKGFCWTLNRNLIFSLDLKSRKITPHPWKEPKEQGSTLFLLNEKIFSFGGEGEHPFRRDIMNDMPSKTVESFDLTKPDPEWTEEPDLVVRVSSPYAIQLSNKVYVMGGERPRRNRSYDEQCTFTQVFDLESDTWRHFSQMPSRCWEAKVLTLNEKIFLVGGTENLCLSYDPTKNAWAVLKSPSFGKYGSTAIATAWKGKILLYDTRTHRGEVYDPDFDCWSVKNDLFDEDTKGYETMMLCSMSL